MDLSTEPPSRSRAETVSASNPYGRFGVAGVPFTTWSCSLLPGPVPTRRSCTSLKQAVPLFRAAGIFSSCALPVWSHQADPAAVSSRPASRRPPPSPTTMSCLQIICLELPHPRLTRPYTAGLPSSARSACCLRG